MVMLVAVFSEQEESTPEMDNFCLGDTKSTYRGRWHGVRELRAVMMLDNRSRAQLMSP